MRIEAKDKKVIEQKHLLPNSLHYHLNNLNTPEMDGGRQTPPAYPAHHINRIQ